MSEGRKRSRKSKLEVRSDVDVEETENAILQLPQVVTKKPKIIDHTYSLNDVSTPPTPIQLSVKVEVEEFDESIMENETEGANEDLLSLIAGPSSTLNKLKKKTPSSVPVFHITLEKMYKISDHIAWSSTNPADKFLGIELKNIWGRVLKYDEDSDPHDMLVQKALKAWRIGLVTGKVWKDTPIFYQCHLCNLAWWYLDPFRDHIRSHDNKLIKVYIQVNKHESIVVASNDFNNGIKYIPCEGNCYRCGRSFESHVKTPSSPYKCLECDESLPICSMLMHHLSVCIAQKTISSPGLKCTICHTQLFTKQELDFHMSLFHLVRSDIPCPYPFKTCAVCDKIYHHYYTHMCMKSSMNAGCNHCYRKFPTKFLSQEHIRTAEKNYQCQICNLILPYKCMLTEHFLTHTDKFKMVYKCINLQCPSTMLFPDETSIRLHRSIHHKQKYDKRRTYYELVLVPEQTQKSSSIVDLDFAAVCEDKNMEKEHKTLASREPNINRWTNEQTDKEILQEDRDIKQEMQNIDTDYPGENESQDENMDYEQMLAKVFKVSDRVRNAKALISTTEIDITEIKTEPDIDFETLIDQQDNPITIKAEPCEIDENYEIDSQGELGLCDIKSEPREYDIDCEYNDIITAVKMEHEDNTEFIEHTDIKILDTYSERSTAVTKRKATSKRPVSKTKQKTKATQSKQKTKPTRKKQKLTKRKIFVFPALPMNQNIYDRPSYVLEKRRVLKKYVPVVDKSKEDNNSMPVNVFLRTYKNNKSLVKQNLNSTETNELKQNNTETVDSNDWKLNTKIYSNRSKQNTDKDPYQLKQNTDTDHQLKQNTDTDPYQLKQNTDIDSKGSKQNTSTDPYQLKQNTDIDSKGSKQNTSTDPCQLKQNTDIDSKGSKQNTSTAPCQLKQNTDIDSKGSKQNTSIDPCQMKQNTDIDSKGSKQNTSTDPCQLKQNTDIDSNGSNQNTGSDPYQLKQNTDTDSNDLKQNTEIDRNTSKQNTEIDLNESSQNTDPDRNGSRQITSPKTLKQRKPRKDKNGVRKSRIYTCCKCGYMNTHKLYRIHVNSMCERSPTVDEHVKYKCTKCDGSFSTMKLYLVHFEMHGYTLLQCPSCNHKFELLKDLMQHIHKHVRQNYVNCWLINKKLDIPTKKQNRCQICRHTVSPQDFFSHWETHLELIGSVKSEPEPVDVSSAVERMPTDGKSLEASVLQMVLQQLRSVQREKECYVCRRQFTRWNDCKRHIVEHLLLDAYTKKSDTLSFRCQICYSSFFRAEQYKFHMREHGALPVYRCDLCNKTFSDSSNFAKHKKIHSLKLLICDICKKKFHAKKSMEKHMMMHRVTEPIKCGPCNKYFYTMSAYNKHLKSRHERLAFKCIICEVTFDCLRKKWDHMWLTHNERKDKADCPICYMGFRKYHDVKLHAKSEHNVDLSFLKIKTEGVLAKVKKFCKAKRVQEETIYIPPEMMTADDDMEKSVNPQLKSAPE